jgi:TfoX/Sxy family transcriptional regulator of competence genes
MDPHKRSVTIEVMTAEETIVDRGRFSTDEAGFAEMLQRAARWPQRVWAVEGCNGIGRHVAVRLVTAGEQVLDVPPKLSARVRTFATGQGRKTDATDADSVALVGTRMAGLRRARSCPTPSARCCGSWGRVGSRHTTAVGGARDTWRMTYDVELADRVRELLREEAGVREQRMFGGVAFLVDGNMAVSASGQGGLLLHVDPAVAKDLVDEPHVRRAEMSGRVMNGWLRVDADVVTTDSDLRLWVAHGVTYAKSLPAK